eukprot:TRINITY_DN23825_c0_g1_i2.p1 TRINITY_DN23825_c0_g1~~TRINITY_DN23825_c0_g1_i2.p1  ORF type:complete len:218 (+),score=37.66 TRINITY_DN23825_c0_g1_i2:62-715(+)
MRRPPRPRGGARPAGRRRLGAAAGAELEYGAVHWHWHDSILVDTRSGRFRRRSNSDGGRWQQHAGGGLTLHWDDHPAERLRCRDAEGLLFAADAPCGGPSGAAPFTLRRCRVPPVGAPAPARSQSRALLFSSVGDQSLPQVEKWLGPSADPGFDVVLVYYRDPAAPGSAYAALERLCSRRRGAALLRRSGFKWPNFAWWALSLGWRCGEARLGVGGR